MTQRYSYQTEQGKNGKFITVLQESLCQMSRSLAVTVSLAEESCGREAEKLNRILTEDRADNTYLHALLKESGGAPRSCDQVTLSLTRLEGLRQSIERQLTLADLYVQLADLSEQAQQEATFQKMSGKKQNAALWLLYLYTLNKK